RPFRLAADPLLTIPMVLRETGLIGEAVNLQIGRVVRLAINVLGDRRRERLAASVYLLRLLRLEFRQPKLASHIITARDRIVASEAVHHEPVPRGAIELDRKRTIGCAVSRSRCEHFTVDHIAAKSLGEFLRRDHGAQRAAWAAAGLRAFRGITHVAPSLSAAA